MMRFSFYVIFTFIIVLLACSDNTPYTSGTDSDNYVKGTVLSTGMEPLADITLYLIKSSVGEDGALFTRVDSTTSNSVGEWEFVAKEGQYSVLSLGNQINKPSMKRAQSSLDQQSNTVIFHTTTTKNFIGRVFSGVDLESDIAITVFVMGTDISTNVEADGSYSLNDIPTGDCDLLFKTASGNYISSLRTGAGEPTIYLKDISLPLIDKDSLNESFYSGAKEVMPVMYDKGNEPEYYSDKVFDGVEYIQASTNDNVVVDANGKKVLNLLDFDGFYNTLLIDNQYTGSGLNSIWHTYILADDGLNTEIHNYVPGVWGNGYDNQFFYGDSTTATAGNLKLLFNYLPYDTLNYGCVDLSKATSINFYMKGTGDIQVMIGDSITVSRVTTVFSQFQKIINPTPDWQYYEIPIDSMVCSKEIDTVKYDLHREGSLEKSVYIKFMTVALPGDTMSFALDQISISGVNIEDLVKR